MHSFYSGFSKSHPIYPFSSGTKITVRFYDLIVTTDERRCRPSEADDVYDFSKGSAAGKDFSTSPP